MADRMFDTDSPAKLGNADWEDGDDFTSFVDALNRGVSVRPNGLQGASELPRENELDAVELARLKHLFASYR